MAPVDIFSGNAAKFGIDIAEPSGLGRIRVCKRMLVGLSSLLELSYSEVLSNLDRLEQELLAIKNVLEQISRISSMKIFLIRSGYVSSIDSLLMYVRDAYNYTSTALWRQQDPDKRLAYLDINRCFDDCKDAIYNALGEFDESV